MKSMKLSLKEQLKWLQDQKIKVDTIEKMLELETLNLESNYLTSIPNLNLPNLKYLHLNNNQLTTIPVFNLPELKALSIENNQLVAIPHLNLPNLKYLYLHNNQLTAIPTAFKNVPFIAFFNNVLMPYAISETSQL